MGKTTTRKQTVKTLYNGKVKVNTVFPRDTYKSLSVIKTNKGFSSEQEVIRFIVTDFIKKNS